jgi:polar amino acid transport system substrate-binding protein
MSRVLRAAAITAIVALIAACTNGGGTSTPPSASPTHEMSMAESASSAPSASAAAEACSPESLETTTAGTLTIGTDNPAFPPYWNPPAEGETGTDPWELGDPTNKGGFEGAVAWAVADELGFTDDTVEFIPVPFDNSFAPGEKDFDFYLAQVSFSDERAEAVDLTDGYFFSNQALVANADTPITEAASIADVADYRLGVQQGTTSLAYIEEEIQPATEAMVYNSNDAAIAALNADQVDGIVVDLPTAFFITAVQMESGTIVGQFPNAGDEQEYFSLVLEQDSPLTDCVNQAIASLTDSGDLQAITTEWMSENAGAPVLE